MKLYYSKGACSLAVRIVLKELNITCEFEAVNLKTKQTETGADFFKINPKGSVPALQLDNGEVLTENSAIQQYLADNYNGISLLPAVKDLKRYRVLEWLSFVSTDLHKGCGPLFNPQVDEDAKNTIFRPLLKKKFNLVDQHLAQNQYLMAEQFSLADGYLFVILSWFSGLKLDRAEWKNLSRYFDELKQRRSIHKALEEEGIAI